MKSITGSNEEMRLKMKVVGRQSKQVVKWAGWIDKPPQCQTMFSTVSCCVPCNHNVELLLMVDEYWSVITGAQHWVLVPTLFSSHLFNNSSLNNSFTVSGFEETQMTKPHLVVLKRSEVNEIKEPITLTCLFSMMLRLIQLVAGNHGNDAH